jgi:hypothetical protein
MYLLLVWVIVAIVIPEGGGYLAEYARPRESRRAVVEGLEKERNGFYEAFGKFQAEYKQKCSHWYADNDNMGGERFLGITEEEVYNRVEFNKKVFPVKFLYAEDRYRVLEHYAAGLQRWSQMRESIVRPSLCILYRNVVQAIAGTNIESYDAALRHARTYREALMNYLRPKVGTPEWVTRVLGYPDMQPTEENQRYWAKLVEKEGGDVYRKIFSWDRVTSFDLSAMPRPEIKFPSLAERIVRVAMDVLLLVGITGLFLGLAIRRVLNYTP